MPVVGRTLSRVRLDKIAIIVDDYDQAVEFFVGALGFELAEDSPSLTNDGRPKRWVVVRPPGAQTGVLLARADGPRQAAAVGNQVAGRVGFFTEVLGFELVEDSPSLTNDGRPKRWVVVRPPGAQTGILLARADGERQAAAVGNQMAGRVGFFLQVDDFDAAVDRMTAAGVRFLTTPRTEPYGRVAVFVDVAGNRWDLLGPAA